MGTLYSILKSFKKCDVTNEHNGLHCQNFRLTTSLSTIDSYKLW